MTPNKQTLWGLMLLPLGLLLIGLLIASTFYSRYLDRISSSWKLLPSDNITALTSDKIQAAMESKTPKASLSKVELSQLASTLLSWIDSQRAGTLDSFISFRTRGLKNGDVAISEALAHYYQQFLGLRETRNSTEGSQTPQTDSDIVSAIYTAHTSEQDLSFQGKRLCIACIKSVSLNSLDIRITRNTKNPLNEFMNGTDRLSLESFTGVFEAAGKFKHHLSGLTARSKTANISFIMGSGNGPRSAYKCGMQLIWLPERKVWFPIELMIGYPGDRMPMEAFLF